MGYYKNELVKNNFRNRTFTTRGNYDNVSAEISSEGIDNFLDALDDDDIKRNILFKAVKSGGKVLQQTTKYYFKNAIGDAANHISKYIKAPFQDGIVLKGDKAYIEARVSIMKDFRMKFFETGTEERYTKQKGHSDLKRGRHQVNTGKPNYRGKIKATHFFKNARDNSKEAVSDAMQISIDKEIKKLQRGN